MVMSFDDFNRKMSIYFNNQYDLEQLIISTIQSKDDLEENFVNIIEKKIKENKEDLLLLIKLLLSLSNNYQRSENFFPIIENIFIFCKKEMQEFFNNVDIFNICKTNKRILLFLFENGYIIPDHFDLNFSQKKQNCYKRKLFL